MAKIQLNKSNQEMKKLLITFGTNGLWFNSKINQKVKHYNVSTPPDSLMCKWWEGLETFTEQKKKITTALRNVDEIVILSEIFSGFFAGFICPLILFAKSKGKKVVLITSENTLNDINLTKYLSDKIEIINVMNTKQYRKNLHSKLSLFELETCLNNLYINTTEAYIQERNNYEHRTTA